MKITFNDKEWQKYSTRYFWAKITSKFNQELFFVFAVVHFEHGLEFYKSCSSRVLTEEEFYSQGWTIIEEIFKPATKINYQVGKLYPEGFYAGSMNEYHYFVESNNNEKMNWDKEVSYYNSSDFVLPTKDELIMMYKNKTEFNKNCPVYEKWNNNYYWSSSESNSDNSWTVHFSYGFVDSGPKINNYYVRGVRKIPMK